MNKNIEKHKLQMEKQPYLLKDLYDAQVKDDSAFLELGKNIRITEKTLAKAKLDYQNEIGMKPKNNQQENQNDPNKQKSGLVMGVK